MVIECHEYTVHVFFDKIIGKLLKRRVSELRVVVVGDGVL